MKRKTRAGGEGSEKEVDSKRQDAALTGIEVGDEIIITKKIFSHCQEFKEGVWIVRSLETKSLILQRHYNNYEMLAADDKIIRPKKIVKEDLLKSLAKKIALPVKIKTASKDPSLQELCARFIAREFKRYRRSVRELPTELLETIQEHAEDITLIPIEYRIRQLAARNPTLIADSPRMSKLTSPGGSEWAQRNWRLVPATASYFAIWRACADALQPSQPEVPKNTAAFWMEPVRGPAAAMRGYLEACRRGDECFELVFEYAWVINPTIFASTPTGPMVFGIGWR